MKFGVAYQNDYAIQLKSVCGLRNLGCCLLPATRLSLLHAAAVCACRCGCSIDHVQADRGGRLAEMCQYLAHSRPVARMPARLPLFLTRYIAAMQRSTPLLPFSYDPLREAGVSVPPTIRTDAFRLCDHSTASM